MICAAPSQANAGANCGSSSVARSSKSRAWALGSFACRHQSSRPRRKQSKASILLGLLRHQPMALALREVERKRAHDLPGHVILHGENVGQIPIEPLRPEMTVIGGVDELSRDPHALADFAHAALEHITDAKSLADLLDLDVPAFEGE